MLETLLADPRWANDAVPYRELRGFLFAVGNGPELIPPSEWLEEIFGGAEPDEDKVRLQAALDELMVLYNESVTPLPTSPPGLPPGVVVEDPPLANFEDGAPLAAWARGFLRGYGWIEESWDGVDEEFGTVIAALGFFSSRQFAADVFKVPASALADLAVTTLEVFAEAAVDYQRVGRAVAAELAEDA